MNNEILELDFWRENLYKEIGSIANLEYQINAWLNNSLPEVCDSFEESCMRILDDNDLKEFCEDYKLFFGNNDFYKLIYDFFLSFEKYIDDSKYFDIKGYLNLTDYILWDQKWLKVIEKASLVIENWDYDNLKINNSKLNK